MVNNGCLGKQKERNVELAPVHVFENDKVCRHVMLDQVF